MQARSGPAWAMLCALLVAGALPLLAHQPAPLQDWPNHLARVHILDRLLRGDAFWQRFYVLNTFRVPNVALDLGVLGLLRAGCSPAAAGSVFLVLCYGLFVAGFCALASRFGRIGLARVAAGVSLFYTAPLFWGLVNYVFATGLLMAALALWLAARQHLAWRLAVAAAGAAAVFFCHVIAALGFAAALGGFELGAAWKRRNWRAALPLSGVAALLAVLLLLRSSPHEPLLIIDYVHVRSFWALARWKLVIFAQLPIGADRLYRAVTLLGAVLAAVATLAARPSVRLPPVVVAPIGVLVLLALAAPERVGGGALLDERLALLPLLLAASAVQIPARSPARTELAATVAAMAAVARVLALGLAWRHAGAEFAAYDRAVQATVPPGAMMLLGVGRPTENVSWPEFWSKPYTSIEAQAVFHGVFVPEVFAGPLQQPITLRAEFADLDQLWDFSAEASRLALARHLQPYCAGARRAEFSAIAITRLYPPATSSVTPLRDSPVAQILDACRLGASP